MQIQTQIHKTGGGQNYGPSLFPIGVDTDIDAGERGTDSDMTVSINLGVLLEGSYRAPVKGFGVDIRHVSSWSF